MRMEGLSVDGQDDVQELALSTEGGQALQEAGTVAGCREGALEGPVLIGHAGGESREGVTWRRGLEVLVHTKAQKNLKNTMLNKGSPTQEPPSG